MTSRCIIHILFTFINIVNLKVSACPELRKPLYLPGDLDFHNRISLDFCVTRVSKNSGASRNLIYFAYVRSTAG